MEQQTTETSSAGKGLSVAGMVLGIVALIISFVPCLGMYALLPGVIGLVLSIVGFVQANKAGAAKGMAIAGIALSVVGCAIAGWQYNTLSKAASVLKEEIDKIDTAKVNKAFRDLATSIDSAAKQLPADTTSAK